MGRSRGAQAEEAGIRLATAEIVLTSTKLSDWLQILAAIGVIAGLVFVAEEIRQNNRLARAESVREIYLVWQDIYRFGYAHDVQLLLQKSIEKPSELTDAEILRLSEYYFMVLDAYLVQVAMHERFDLAYNAYDYLFDLAPMFTSEFGRNLLRENEQNIGAESDAFLDALKAEVDKSPIRTEYEYLEALKVQPRQSD